MKRKLAIVGREENTRNLAPWDDPDYDILVFNEEPLSDWCKRWDILLQIHTPDIYQNLNNPRDPNYWNWLQQKHDRPIYMQFVDPAVPDSIKFPVDEINQEFTSTLTYEGKPGKNIRATVCFAMALGLYLGYEEIHVWGIELTYAAEYRSQQTNFSFWVGVATGRKVKVTMHCCKGMFDQPLYGYEPFMQEDRIQRYLEGVTEQEAELEKQITMVRGAKMMLTQMLVEVKEGVEVVGHG